MYCIFLDEGINPLPCRPLENFTKGAWTCETIGDGEEDFSTDDDDDDDDNVEIEDRVVDDVC